MIMAITPTSGQPIMPPLPDNPQPLMEQQDQALPQETLDMVQINVPVTIPKNMMVPDKEGKREIDNFDVQLVPKGSVITSQDEIQTLVKNVKEQTLPPGMVPQIPDSPAGDKINKIKGIANMATMWGGGIANMNLMGSSPASWAGPVASVAGVMGAISGLDSTKKALDVKHFLKGLKAQGKEFWQEPVKNKDGTTSIQTIPIDDMITNANDAAIVGGMQTLSSALTAGAGLGGGPVFAIASLVVSIGALLVAKRHAIAGAAKKVGSFLKNKFVAVKNRFTGKTKHEQPLVDPAALKETRPAKEQPPATSSPPSFSPQTG
jgi:hypothetical protein